jgi:hypothetical protein
LRQEKTLSVTEVFCTVFREEQRRSMPRHTTLSRLISRGRRHKRLPGEVPDARSMEGLSLPMAPDDERLWLLGLLGFAVAVVLAAVVWTSVPSGTATVRVVDAGTHAPLDVTVERVGDERTTVAETTVRGDYGTVYRTSEAGLYAVTLHLGGDTCERRFGLVREDRKLREDHVVGDSPGACPVDVTVDVSPV